MGKRGLYDYFYSGGQLISQIDCNNLNKRILLPHYKLKRQSDACVCPNKLDNRSIRVLGFFVTKIDFGREVC